MSTCKLAFKKRLHINGYTVASPIYTFWKMKQGTELVIGVGACGWVLKNPVPVSYTEAKVLRVELSALWKLLNDRDKDIDSEDSSAWFK